LLSIASMSLVKPSIMAVAVAMAAFLLFSFVSHQQESFS
jgi:hypothetical protein